MFGHPSDVLLDGKTMFCLICNTKNPRSRGKYIHRIRNENIKSTETDMANGQDNRLCFSKLRIIFQISPKSSKTFSRLLPSGASYSRF